jgi:hypothetical protein
LLGSLKGGVWLAVVRAWLIFVRLVVMSVNWFGGICWQ